jgi:hypothetical protein
MTAYGASRRQPFRRLRNRTASARRALEARAEVRVSIAELRFTLAASELPIGVSETAQCSQRRKPPGTQALFLVPRLQNHCSSVHSDCPHLESHICLDT